MGPYEQPPALHAPGQVEQEYWFATAQNVPNTGSVKPPELGQNQLVASEYSVGCVLHTVAASFHARHAYESPVLYGYTPPSGVALVALYVLVSQPAIGLAQP